MPARALQQPEAPVAVCVVAPRVEPVAEGDALGVVPAPSPQLVVLEPLRELRIERDGRAVWQRLAPVGQPLRSPLPWPVAPIQPGEVLLLRLRPEQAPEGAFAHVRLVGASAERMASTAALIRSLGQKPPAWLAAIDQALRTPWDRAHIRAYAEANTWDRRIDQLEREFLALARFPNRKPAAAAA